MVLLIETDIPNLTYSQAVFAASPHGGYSQ